MPKTVSSCTLSKVNSRMDRWMDIADLLTAKSPRYTLDTSRMTCHKENIRDSPSMVRFRNKESKKRMSLSRTTRL